MTGIQRHFLGWDTPFLPATGKWLQENCLQRELGSVAGTIVVVSSSEVARRLQSILLERASEDNRAIDMPQIVTPSSLLHLLYEGALRLANSQVLKLATTQALRELPEESIRPLVHRVQQSRSDYSSWISIAQDVNTIAREIESGGHHTDPSTWPDASRMLLSSAAYAKFEAVHIVRCKTRELLQLAGFCFTEDAWCEVLQSSKEISNIILLNLNDMNTAVSSAIQSLSNKGTTVTSVIRAPELLEAHFDSFGRVVPEQWNQKIVPIKEQTISVAGSPAHQAQLFLQQLSKQTEYSSDEVTIAVTNQDAIDSIRLHIEGHSVPTRYAGGHSMLETPELGLLAILHKFLQTKSFASYAELVRNPIVSSTLSITSDEIHHLDAFYKNHMPSFISKNWYVPTEVSKYIKVKPVISLHSKVFPWIEPLLSDTSDVSGSVELVRSFILSLFKDDE